MTIRTILLTLVLLLIGVMEVPGFEAVSDAREARKMTEARGPDGHGALEGRRAGRRARKRKQREREEAREAAEAAEREAAERDQDEEDDGE